MLDADRNSIEPRELTARVDQLVAAARAVDPSDTKHDEMSKVHANALHVLTEQVVVPEAGGAGPLGPFKRLVKTLTRKLVWWYVEPRWRIQRDFDTHAAHFASAVTNELGRLSAELDHMRQHHREQQLRLAVQVIGAYDQLASVGQTLAQLDASQRSLAQRADALETELAGVQSDLAAGVGELRAQMLANVRAVGAVRDHVAQALGRSSASALEGAQVRYRALDERNEVTLSTRYRSYLAWLPDPPDGPIAVLECGRGEIVEVLVAAGLDVKASDRDSHNVVHCKLANLDVAEADPNAFIATFDDSSLRAVLSAHCVDRLLLSELELLFESCHSKLRPGGTAIFEATNAKSLAAVNDRYGRPGCLGAAHADVLTELCKQIGFSQVDIVETGAHPAGALADDIPDEATRRAFAQLTETVFGNERIVVIAIK